MDYLTIDDLVISGTHGYYPHERTTEQTFIVSMRVGTHLRAPGQSDALADTIDYDLLKRIIEETFANESRFLIESLAETVCMRVLDQTPALEVSISIQKPEVWGSGVPGVVLHRAKALT